MTTSTVSTAPLRVLAVDDNAALRRFLVAGLTASGCAVTAASTAEQAMAVLETETFDLVVSDIRMPGLSGLDLLRAIKGRQPDIPVVLITGVPSVDSAVFGLRHGAYDYLPKPFTIKEIQGLVERVREDRLRGVGALHTPSGLADELARRRLGVEALLQIGDLAVQGLPLADVVAGVMALAARSLAADATVVLLRDERGALVARRHGDGAIADAVEAAGRRAFDDVAFVANRDAAGLDVGTPQLTALATVVPGTGGSTGLLCVARGAARGAFVPDERGLLLGFAQGTAVALEKLLLRDRIDRNLVDTISAFVNVIESKDRYLKGHSARVALYAAELAMALRMPAEQTQVAYRGAMLHDLGKLSIMEAILRKPARLTVEEFALIKAHPVIGAQILEPVRFLSQETGAVRHHHERFDGAGYPDGLQGEDIPLVARVVTVADVFDAITSDRPYRTALPPDEARREIVRGRGSHFDPDVVDAFMQIPLARLADITRHYGDLGGHGQGAPARAVARLIPAP